MSRKLKTSLLILVSVSVVILAIVGLGRDIFHAIEEIFYDHQATLLTNNAFSRLTNKINVFAAIFSLFLIPLYTRKLVEKDYEIPNFVYSIKFILTVLLIFLVILVVVVLWPMYCILEGFGKGSHEVFLGDCLYTHVLIPFLIIVSFFVLDDRQQLSGKEALIVTIILSVYTLEYALFVFILKTWFDFYFIKEAAEVVTFYAIIPTAILIIIGAYFGSKFLVKRLSEKK